MGKSSEKSATNVGAVIKATEKKKKKSRRSDKEKESRRSEKEKKSESEKEKKSTDDMEVEAVIKTPQKKKKKKKKSKGKDKSDGEAVIEATTPLKKRKDLGMTRMCNLSPELVGEKILTRIPITSLRAVRSTCKLWESLSKSWILGKAAPRQQFLGFMTMDYKICSLRFDLRKVKDVEVDLSINQVELLSEVEISKVFQCDGLLLCVTKDNSRLLVWNPYLGQTRCIGPRTNFHKLDRYALGYDYNNRSHKILRFLDDILIDSKHAFGYEIYDLSSNSWRVLDVTPDWEVEYYQRGVSLKGNAYFFAQEKITADECLDTSQFEDFLLFFDFTSEKFGPRLPLPFHSYVRETVTFSCVREEQLSVLYQRWDSYEILEIWVTTDIEHNTLSWSKFLKVDMRPLTGFQFDEQFGSFFIDEEEKVAVVFDLDGYDGPCDTPSYHTAFIIGDDGYFKSVSLGEASDLRKPSDPDPISFPMYYPPLVCSSSYLPSLVQINRRRKRKHLDD